MKTWHLIVKETQPKHAEVGQELRRVRRLKMISTRATMPMVT